MDLYSGEWDSVDVIYLDFSKAFDSITREAIK